MPQNMNLAVVFNRLGLAEKFGTGVGRILLAYRSGVKQSDFEITDHHIFVTLPILERMDTMPAEAGQILNLIEKGIEKRPDLLRQSGLNNYQFSKAVKFLLEKGLIQKPGHTKATRFIPR